MDYKIKYFKEEDFSFDKYLFHKGEYFKSYDFLGAHKTKVDGEEGYRFLVWAPNARKVEIVGDFNDWNGYTMKRIPNSKGIWNIFIIGLEEFTTYKYQLTTRDHTKRLKADPYAFHSETRPKTASKTFDIDQYTWHDESWMKKREETNIFEKPINIYEMNLMSWKKHDNDEPLSYRQIASALIDHLKEMDYTHVEFMPLFEHPFDGSWGYQTTGYFAITSRFGTPDDFMYLVDQLHQNNIGVIMDWVPCHFCKDDHGLRQFDGQPVYEPEELHIAENVQWDTLNFDYTKPEVISFLVSSAMYLLDYYHIDGIRVDAVAHMIYREEGVINHDAVEFIKILNKNIFKHYNNIMMIAEESSAWPLVTAPVDKGGLGFNFKWNMGWMNDVLEYMELDPVFRKHHHNLITFSITYAFSENFILPLSHDEVVHGKKSLLNKMPGDYWQQFANLRLLYSYLITHPGKKLLFMGGEFAQYIEWNEWQPLDWFLIDKYEKHGKMKVYVQQLNEFYKSHKALYEVDFEYDGFEWIDADNSQNSTIAFMRFDKEGNFLIIVSNFTPETMINYRIGVPKKGIYKEVFNSDLEAYGGVGKVNDHVITTENVNYQNYEQSIQITVPPLGTTILKLQEGKGGKDD